MNAEARDAMLSDYADVASGGGNAEARGAISFLAQGMATGLRCRKVGFAAGTMSVLTPLDSNLVHNRCGESCQRSNVAVAASAAAVGRPPATRAIRSACTASMKGTPAL